MDHAAEKGAVLGSASAAPSETGQSPAYPTPPNAAVSEGGDAAGEQGPSGPPQPQLHFADHFWGETDRGLDALVLRMKNAKHNTEEIISMLQTRASIEEEYSKKLMKLYKQPLGRTESGTLKASLDVIHAEIEASARAHHALAGELRAETEKPLQDFLSAQLVRRRAQQANAERALKAKVLQQVQVQKTKEKYEQRFAENQNLHATAAQGNTKEADKARGKLEKSAQQLKLADSEYQRAVETLHDLARKWEEDFTACCEECETLEQSRLEQLRTFLWKYTNIVSVACVAVDESSERVRVSLEQCNAAADIEEVCTTLGTGRDRPRPPPYIRLGGGGQSGGGRESVVSSSSSIPASVAAGGVAVASIGQRHSSNYGLQPPSDPYGVPPMQNQMSQLSVANYAEQPAAVPPPAAAPVAVAAAAAAAPAPAAGDEEYEEYDIWDVDDKIPILFKVRVLYPYAAQAPEELSIAPGEILDITAQQNDGWWESIQWAADPFTGGQGKRRRKGLLPSNFVEVLPPST